MISITVAGVAYEVPSSAADTNWAAKQVAFEQAVATETTSLRTGLTSAQSSITSLDTRVDALEAVTWTPLSHENTWGNDNTVLAATKDPAGWVSIRGDVFDGTEPSLCFLPNGYEPLTDQHFLVPCGASKDRIALVTVSTNGEVTLTPSVGTVQADVYEITYLNVRYGTQA